jgi:hypothetical protein
MRTNELGRMNDAELQELWAGGVERARERERED